MTNSSSAQVYYLDTYGLQELAAQKSGNFTALLTGEFGSGNIKVPGCSWNEFCDLFPDDAALIAAMNPEKVRFRKKAYAVKAASIAESLNSGFVFNRYNSGTDMHVAAIACVEKGTVLTTSSEIDRYKQMNCNAITIDDWLALANSNS